MPGSELEVRRIMLRVLWHRIVVIVVGSQPEIDLFEIWLADVDLVDRADDRAILKTDAEGFRVHLHSRAMLVRTRLHSASRSPLRALASMLL